MLLLSILSSVIVARHAAAVELVSVDLNAVAGNAASNGVAVNANGNFVAFYSDATDLVTGDTNQVRDVFLRDRLTQATERVSVNSAGMQANGASHALGDAPAINGDGQVVAFYSDATNLVFGDTNDETDVFVRLRGSAKTERVSLTFEGGQGNGPSLSPSISADGRFVAFQSFASNLVSDDTNTVADIFVRDRVAITTERVCDQIQANNFSSSPSISADGNVVAFTSAATNLVPHDINNHLDVFACDRRTGAIDIVSVSSAEVQGNGDSILPAVSEDGRFVAFKSVATNLVPNDNNGLADVFVRDRLMGTTERVSVNVMGGDSNGGSFPPSIDYAGRFVAFGSEASNLVSHDTNGVSDVFVRDRQIGFTLLVDVNDRGDQANNGTLDVPPSVSGDASAIGFISLASNLVNNDLNGVADVYITSNPFSCPTGICPKDLVCSNGMCGPEVPPTATPTLPAPTSTPPTSTATPTGGGTATETSTPTQTGTPTGTATLTASATPTGSGSPTTSPTETSTPGTATPTGSITATASATVTATAGTPTASVTASDTATPTGTTTSTAGTATVTGTVTPSASVTATGSSTPTVTSTGTASQTATTTASGTATGTSTPTASGTATASETATQTSRATATTTASATASFSSTVAISTATPSQTASATASRPPSATATLTATATATRTGSATASRTASATSTPTLTRTATVIPSMTPTQTGGATPGRKLDKDACQCAVSSPSQTRRGALMWFSGVAALLLRRRRFKSPRGQR